MHGTGRLANVRPRRQFDAAADLRFGASLRRFAPYRKREPVSDEASTESKPKAPKPRRRWRRWLGRAGMALGALASLAGLALADAWTAMGTSASGKRLERMRASPRFSEGRFHNRLDMQEPALWPVLKGWLGGDEVREPSDAVPIVRLAADSFSVPPDSGLRITWLGHSTVLIEVDGKRVLTDPVWGERASPLSFAGPKRFHDPPLALDDLPPLDAVLISHDHYDHLDEPTMRALIERVPTFFVPLGVGAHLEYWGARPEQLVELDWWERKRIGDVEIVSAPARHFSGRSLSDRNATLWTAWAVLGPEHRVFFSGDTAMFPGFSEIGRRLGPFDATLIEVGAYSPLWADAHLGPEQAVAAHRDLRGEHMIPVHWGTFNLAFHAWTEPAERLTVAAREAGVTVSIPRPGESIEPTATTKLARWWPEVPWRSAKQVPVVSSGLESATR